jgi:hypothetical protein
VFSRTMTFRDFESVSRCLIISTSRYRSVSDRDVLAEHTSQVPSDSDPYQAIGFFSVNHTEVVQVQVEELAARSGSPYRRELLSRYSRLGPEDGPRIWLARESDFPYPRTWTDRQLAFSGLVNS